MLRSKPSRTRAVFTATLTIVGIGLITFAGYGLVGYYDARHEGGSVPIPEVSADDTTVSEKAMPVSDDDSYTVPAGQPRVIRIPSLSVEAYVQRVAVDADRVMSSPNNVNLAGWYTASVVPGDSGLSIINGHVSGRYTPGIFKDIHKLKTDDIVTLQMGDRTERRFKAVSVKTYPVDEATKPLFEDDPSIDQELHLITCAGKFDDASQTYTERTIIVLGRTP